MAARATRIEESSPPDKEYDIGELKYLMPSKKIKNYQQKLI